MRLLAIMCVVLVVNLIGCMTVPPHQVPSQTVIRVVVELKTIIGRAGSMSGQFFQPRGVAVGDGEKGRVYVGDTGNQSIQVFNQAGEYQFQFGKFGSGPAQFNQPHGLALSGGTVLVVDQMNHRVQRFNWRGDYLDSFGTLGNQPNQLNTPTGIMVDQFKQIWIADSNNDRISGFNQFFDPIIQLGGYGLGPGFLKQPIALTSGRFNQLWIADQGNHRIQKISSQGDYLYQFGDQTSIASLSGITQYKQLIIACDAGNNQLLIYKENGQLLRTVTAPGLQQPSDVKVNSEGIMAVADAGHHRVVVY